MKILWLINIVLPEAGQLLNIPSSVFGGWLTGALNGIRDRVGSITIATVSDSITEQVECEMGNVNYIVFPQMDKGELEEAFCKYLCSNQFDIIHIFGTEGMHSAAMMSVSPPEKTVVTIQGLTYYYAKYHYMEGIPASYILDTFYKKVLRFLTHRIEESVVAKRATMLCSGQREYEIISKCRYIIGRTSWDKACVTQINPDVKYFHVNETLRKCFYDKKTWKPQTCKRHSIFLSQAGYPIKGLHYFLQALLIVKQFYPDVVVNIGGGSVGIKKTTGWRLWRNKHLGGYYGYLNTLVSDSDLTDRIHFLGMLTDEEMVEQYLKANVFVCPSTIENSPNSVGEAMMLGTPVVASYVGGTPDLVVNRKEGLLFQSSAPYMLADCIMRIFKDDEFASYLSKNAIVRANATHDREKNSNDLIKVYDSIAQGLNN